MTKIKTLKLDYWTEIMIDISNHNNSIISQIQHRTKYTYSYIVNILQILEKKHYIIKKAKGRTQIIEMTAKGYQIVKTITELKEQMK